MSLRVRQLYCRNLRCARRTFAERLPELMLPHARQTCRLAAAQGRFGIALGGDAAATLGHADQRRHVAAPDQAHAGARGGRAPHRGWDDWAICKGRTCGTVVVDLESRRVVDLLPDRTSATTAEWLQQRRGVKVVARDRFTEYARAISIGAPRAVQVTDW